MSTECAAFVGGWVYRLLVFPLGARREPHFREGLPSLGAVPGLGARQPLPKMRFAAHAEGENEQSRHFALVCARFARFPAVGWMGGVRL